MYHLRIISRFDQTVRYKNEIYQQKKTIITVTIVNLKKKTKKKQ